jgi:lactate dehydrogenase-like 2-hydroxyacid dehydrogenase
MTTAVLARSASEIAETARRIEQAGALLVNAARGGLIDYRALRDVLSIGHLGGVGLDVCWGEPFLPDDPPAETPEYNRHPARRRCHRPSLCGHSSAVATNI